MQKISKFEEKWNYFKSGFKHLPQVIESRINKVKDDFGVLSPAKKAEAERRLEICMNCPFNSNQAPFSKEYKDLMGKPYYSHREQADIHCSLCGCDLDYKVLSFESACGLFDYNKANPHKPQQPVKWGSFYDEDETTETEPVSESDQTSATTN